VCSAPQKDKAKRVEGTPENASRRQKEGQARAANTRYHTAVNRARAAMRRAAKKAEKAAGIAASRPEQRKVGGENRENYILSPN
jgi:hypothetical protein